MATWSIVKEGFFFRAVNNNTGWSSSLLTSASQAGMVIGRKAGKDAHRAAAEKFIKEAA